MSERKEWPCAICGSPLHRTSGVFDPSIEYIKSMLIVLGFFAAIILAVLWWL